MPLRVGLFLVLVTQCTAMAGTRAALLRRPIVHRAPMPHHVRLSPTLEDALTEARKQKKSLMHKLAVSAITIDSSSLDMIQHCLDTASDDAQMEECLIPGSQTEAM